tara:strand:- start:50 stop:967 length:918 start_codon:yes stop_codon:yes gene_type:complete
MNKVIFLGTPDFAVPVLQTLINNNINIKTVFTQPAKKSNRGQKIFKSPVHLFAEKYNLNIKTPKNIENEENYIKSMDIDLGIVVAYGQIIPENVLNSCKLGFINVHASLLPKYRGAAPIQRSLINLEKFTGISFMKINKTLDSGPICNQYKIKIEDKDNYKTLMLKLGNLSADKIIENLNLVFSKKANFKKQNHKDATYAKKINKSEGKINWNDNARNIIGKINGLYPNPGAWFEFEEERYKIVDSKISEKNGKPGLVIDDALTVACGANSIKINRLQRQGKKVQNSKEFLMGSRIKKGSFLKND